MESPSSVVLSKIRIFRHTFLGNCEAEKIETWYTHGQWADVSCTPESGCCCLFVFFFFFISKFQHWNFSSHFSRELWGLENWNLVHTWTVGRCIMYTGVRLLLLIHSFISSFFFLSNFQHWKFSSHFSRELWGLEDWKLVHTWTVGNCIMFTGIRLLLVIRLFISSFFFLSNFQHWNLLFCHTVRPRRLKLGTQVDSGQMYHVYWNQAAAAFLSLYFFILLSLQFSKIKIFRHTFLRNCKA